MFDFLFTFIVGLLIVLSFQYNYAIFSVIIAILYSIFNPGLSNLLFIAVLAVVIILKFGEIPQLWQVVLGIIIFIILVSAIFGKKKEPEEEGGGYEDLLKMLGNQQ